MEHLLSVWPRIAGQLEQAPHIWLFADYDGTLTPIVQRPELAVLPEINRQLLEMLARHSKVTIGVISGRAVADLKNLIRVNNIIYAGNHGMEIESPGMNYQYPLGEDIKVLFSILFKVLNKAFAGIPGVIVEDKGLTFSIHYRQVDKSRVPEVQDIFYRSIGSLNATNKVKITKGKKVLEIRPVTYWNKGKAVKFIMRRGKKVDRPNEAIPIYLGDDLTDEDAFRQINKYNNGVTVFIGENYRETSAQYYLHSTGEVTRLLEYMLEMLGKHSE